MNGMCSNIYFQPALIFCVLCMSIFSSAEWWLLLWSGRQTTIIVWFFLLVLFCIGLCLHANCRAVSACCNAMFTIFDWTESIDMVIVDGYWCPITVGWTNSWVRSVWRSTANTFKKRWDWPLTFETVRVFVRENVAPQYMRTKCGLAPPAHFCVVFVRICVGGDDLIVAVLVNYFDASQNIAFGHITAIVQSESDENQVYSS